MNDLSLKPIILNPHVRVLIQGQLLSTSTQAAVEPAKSERGKDSALVAAHEGDQDQRDGTRRVVRPHSRK